MKEALIYWDSDPPDTNANVEEIDHFDARGMHRVYGRGDHFGIRCSFHMDIWKTSDERLLMRCWSRRQEVDWRSFEIMGVDFAEIPECHKCKGFLDIWVPGTVRQAYDQWINEEF